MFESLMKHGIDPKQVDFAGNTVWHASVPFLARHYRGEPVPTGLVRHLGLIGVDPLQPNHEGQTPLHLFSMFQTGGFDDREDLKRQGYTGLDYLISLQRDVNHADRNGVTALHHASSFSEFNTRRLLEAGADASLATNEGLNALHIAARSRQPNILGMLLDSLRENASPDVFRKTVNASTPCVRGTPLHFACASGRAESVKLLLEAGAAVGTKFLSCSPWISCLGFEAEDANWPEHDSHTDYYQADSGSVELEGKHRTLLGRAASQGVERMDAIVDLLASYSPESTRHIDHIINSASAASCPSDYLVECLVRKRKAIQAVKLAKPFSPAAATIFSLRRRQANRNAVDDGGVYGGGTVRQGTSQIFQILMSLKEYNLAIKVLRHGVCLEQDQHHRTILHGLVAEGFASMLKAVAKKDEVQSLDNYGYRMRFCNAARYGPLLIEACKRKAPNMDVIRVLVETFDVDVNAQTLQHPYDHTTGDMGAYRPAIRHESALHILVRGEHWWQTAQALPYLIQHGADLDLKDADGLTPLHAAFEHLGFLSFNQRAVTVLLSAGADVNTVDNKGQSCLSHAVRDLKMAKLLISHSAIVTPPILAAAINQRKLQLLEALLAYGADPNMRAAEEPTEEDEEARANMNQRTHGPRTIRPEEMYPLHYAVSRSNTNHTADTDKQIIQILLKHGANPCARYRRTTVLHEIIATERLIRESIDLPKLDLETRDADGHTIFLAACKVQPTDGPANSTVKSPAEVLLDRGADPRARNNAGQSALHLFFAAPHPGGSRIRFFQLLLTLVPELVDAPDNAGIRPLHLAIDSSRYTEAYALLGAGADPHARNGDGDTSLHLAMRGTWSINTDGEVNGPRCRVVERFLSLGCEINARNNTGETPAFGFFRDLSVHYDPKLLPGRATTGQEVANMAEAMQERLGEEPLFRLLEAFGVDWTAVSVGGESLLHIVATRREGSWEPETVRRFRFLMGKGLDPARENAGQRTPLDIAAAFGLKSVLDLFKRNGRSGT